MRRNLINIVNNYLICALWTQELDVQYSREDIAPATAINALKDVCKFIDKAKHLLTPEWSDEQIGHDLWLTRNGHGAGFWDRDLPNAKEISEVCKQYFKEVNDVFVDGNNKIVIE